MDTHDGDVRDTDASVPPDRHGVVPPFDPDLSLITYIERSQLPPGEGPWWLPKLKKSR